MGFWETETERLQKSEAMENLSFFIEEQLVWNKYLSWKQ